MLEIFLIINFFTVLEIFLIYEEILCIKDIYDPKKGEAGLWGWINDIDTEDDDLAKGWVFVQAISIIILCQLTTFLGLFFKILIKRNNNIREMSTTILI